MSSKADGLTSSRDFPENLQHFSGIGRTLTRFAFLPLSPVKLSLNEKQTFYHELGRFAQSGITIPQAAESLSADSAGALRRAFGKLSKLFLRGESVSGAFARLQPVIGSMEVALIEASDRSGRLEQAFQYLSSYFGTLDTVRTGIIRRAVWPVVQLHLGVVMLNFASGFVEGTVSGGGFNSARFVMQCVSTLGIFYALVAVLVGGGTALTHAARTSVTVDRLLSLLPMVGRLRRNLSLSRFCASYEMQLSAGVNVMDSVRAAGEASQSARVRTEVARMVPEMMAGQSIGTLIVGATVFPAAFQRSVRTGEATGTLDADLRRWAEYYQKAAIDSLEAAGAWLSRAVTLGILVYLGYKIVTTYSMVLGATYNQAGLNE